MKILVVGGGGREHALLWALAREEPGATVLRGARQPGHRRAGNQPPIAAIEVDLLAEAADTHGIDLTVIGPEVPLALGLADRLRARRRPVFGPSADAARIEASKSFAKEVMAPGRRAHGGEPRPSGARTRRSRGWTGTPSRWW